MPKVQKIEDAGVLSSFPLRVTHRQARGHKGARTLVRCGCCDERLEIYPPSDAEDPFVEIGGVIGTRGQWQQLLGPMLNMEPKK